MPKELFEIKDFQTGTITTISEKDLPPTAASHSFNLDPYAQDGKLKGVQGSKIFTTTGWQTEGTTGIDGFTGEYSAVINNKGVRTLVFYDNDTNKYKHVTNIDATSSQEILDIFPVQTSSNAASMTSNNTELHIGRGDADTQWLGYPQYKQFGQDYSDTLVLEDARLETSSYLDAFYKVVSIVEGDPPIRYFYAVKYKGNYVYKLQQSGTNKYSIVGKSAYRFGSIQGLALRYTGISAQVNGLYTDPILWVYDASIGEYGTVYQYDGSSLQTGQENALTTGPTRNASDSVESMFTDIMEHGEMLWFGRGYDGKTEFKDDLIWNAPIPASGDSIAPTNRTPKLLNFSGLVDTDGGSNSDLAGWTTGVAKGNFSLIPVDSLSVADSGGVDQCFSIPIGKSFRKWPYSSYRVNQAALPRWYSPNADDDTPFNGNQNRDGNGSGKLFSSFRSDLSALHQVCTADEIGPLFGGYYATHRPVPWNQSPRFNSNHGWSWVNLGMGAHTGSNTSIGNATLAAGGISETFTGAKITTKPSYQNKLIPYEFKGYVGNAGVYDTRGTKIVDNDYNRSIGYGTQAEHALRWYYHGVQTEMQFTPDDYIDQEYGLVFWASNDFKGNDAMHATGASVTWKDMGSGSAAVTAMHGHAWGDGDDTHVDLRRLGKTQIDHNIYSRKFNRYDGSLDVNGTDLINSDLTEGNISNWSLGANWATADVQGFNHTAGSDESLKYLGEPDTISDGAQYIVEYDVTVSAQSITIKVGNSTASSAINSTSTGTVTLTAASNLFQGTTGTTASTDHSEVVVEIIPHTNFVGTINSIKVYAKPKTYSVMLPTSFNNAGDSSTIKNTLHEPIGVNYTTPGYRHCKTYPSFNMNANYNTGAVLSNLTDRDDIQYHEVGTNPRTEAQNITQKLSVRSGFGSLINRRAFNFVNPLATTNSWHLNDFAGQHMPFDRHIMAVDTTNKYVFVLNPLYKGWGFPNTDLTECDTGATTTHCVENELTKASAAIADDTITFSGGVVTSDLWVGMTVSHTDIPAGAYITSIESSTVVKINTNATGTSTGQTITFGRYISTDQGTGGNRNVVYIYSYDENGKFKYRGFKHLVRDFIHDYRGDNSEIPGGTIEDSRVIATDIYCKADGANNFLIINTLNGHDSWDIGCDDENPAILSDATRQKRHRIIKVKYSSDLLEWEVPQSQSSYLSINLSNETDSHTDMGTFNAYNGAESADLSWESGVRENEDMALADSAGGGGFCVSHTAFDDMSSIMFKVIQEPYNETQDAAQVGRVSTLYAVGTRANSDRFSERFASWGKLKLTHPTYASISDLSSTMSLTRYGGEFEDTAMPIDFIALDKASRVIYVGTSKTVDHPDSGVLNSRYEKAKVTYTSIQSFPYYPNKLGMNEGASGTDDEVWNNIRKYTEGGQAIDHIVLSTIFHRNGSDSFEDNYSGGNERSCNPYGGIYKQALVTNNKSSMGIKYYSNDGEKLEDVEEVHVQDGVYENLPHGRYLILSGGGVSIPYKHTYNSGIGDSKVEEKIDSGMNSLSLLRAIPITVNGYFIKHPEKKREQTFFRSNFLGNQHGTDNENPWDITSGTFTLSRTNSWGMFSSEAEKTLDEVDSTDVLHHDYKHCVKDQDLWYHSRSLDGPLLGFHDHTGTLFTMAGMRASDNEINEDIGTWDFNLNSTDHDKTGRQFRLYSINLMQHEPISSPLANLIPIGPDSSHKFGGVLFGLQSRNMTANRIIKTSSLAASADEDDRAQGRNNLQTLTTTKSRFVIAAIDKDQTAGTSKAMYTAGNKADGLAAGESRLFGIGQTDIDVRLNDVTSLSIYNRNNQVRANNVQIIGINQIYDDTRLNVSASVDYRYLFTFSYNSYFDPNGLFNKSGLGILSAHASDPFESAQITGALAHGTSLPIRHNRSDKLDGEINLITPYALGIKHGATGADVTSAAKDVGVHFLIGNAFSPFKQPNSYQAGWALGALKYTSADDSVLLMRESQAAGTGGKLADTLSILPKNSDTGDWSEANRKYFYRASFVYDGYQEGPLGDDYSITSTGGDIKLTIRMDTASLSKRATHLNIYRGDNVNEASQPLGFYRLVEQIRLDTSWSLGTDSNDSPQFSNFRFVDYTDTGKSGADYESNSGISEVVDDSNLKYHYSCELNNQLYVAKIGHRMVDNGESTIAKSLPYNYDMFDITKDILRMPSSPTAIGEHGNRIWVFDEGNTYKVEPSNLYIEETFKGTGCFGQNSYVSTEHGLFYCDNSNIYAVMQDGVPRAIGTSIKTGSSYSWDQKDLSYTPIVGYDGNLKTIFFAFKTNSKYYAWGYNIVNTRWDLYKFNNDDTDIIQSFTNDKYGNLLFNVKDTSNNHYLYQFGTDTTKHLNWEWVSKDFTFGHDNVYKKVYNVVSSGSGIVTYDVDGSENPVKALSTTKIPIADRKTKQLKIKVLTLSNGTNKYELDSLGIIFRRLKVTAK